MPQVFAIEYVKNVKHPEKLVSLGGTPALLSEGKAKENGLSCPLHHGLENPCSFDKDARVLGA
jgi:hypothetical protein